MRCDICGANKEGNLFEVSYGKPLTPDQMYTRVCQYKKSFSPCINKSKEIAENSLYLSEREETLPWITKLAEELEKT